MNKLNHSANSKPSFIKSLIPIAIIIVMVFLLLKFMSSMKTEPAVIPDQPKGFLVKTAQLQTTDLTIHIQSQGTVQPKRQINLITEVSGKVQSMNPAFIAGGSFTAGDTLVSLDPTDYQVAVVRAEANLASAQASVDLEQAKSDQAKKDWQSFGKSGKPSELLLNIPQLDGAKASLKAAKADVMKAQQDLQKTQIKAPFDGTVISKSVDLGQYVGMTGMLGVIAGTAVAEVRLPLSNADLEKLELQQHAINNEPVSVIFMDDQERPVANGLIHRLESSKDSKTLMNYAVAEIQDPFIHDLRFNSFVLANITGASFQQVYPVPTAWMMPDDQVAVYAPDNTLDIRSVTVIHKTNDFFYVTDGIDDQDLIITTPVQAPAQGMILRLNQTTTEQPVSIADGQSENAS